MEQEPSGSGADGHGAPPRRTAGRPRSESARRSVLGAAYAILEEGGIEDFSIDRVARLSGVARTTIYRWWPSKAVLAIESFLEQFGPQLAVPRGEAPDQDFRALVRALAAALAGPAGRVAASVVAHAQSDEETQRLFRENFSDPLRTQAAELLERGITHGVFRSDLDIPRVIDAFVGAVYFRLIIGSSLGPDWADALSETILNGCR
ncbi:TetR/AcrR family transcriptional regulator [Amycolatopsis minnesotensis]|uniref:TetR/AcrR family transcriptional regulator n=1 Tax=Amycolatopsis minnesotensis TaxID=337894 RepID=A0ABN2SFA1_9PSEU